MLLVVDIGNTNIVIGVYRADELLHSWRLTTVKERTADEYRILVAGLLESMNIDAGGIEDIIISSVVPETLPYFIEMSEEFFKKTPYVVGPGIKTGMPILFDNPREVGADRIVNAVAAYSKYRQELVIVDFGTATTFDGVSRDGSYLGGAIAPGINVSLEALVSRASKLPKVEIAKPPSIIGKNTIHGIQAGIFHGYLSLIDGMMRKMKDEIGGNCKGIATGGYANLFAPESREIDEVESNLILEGLKIIYTRNIEMR
jgi:type III pantothenate kinase